MRVVEVEVDGGGEKVWLKGERKPRTTYTPLNSRFLAPNDSHLRETWELIRFYNGGGDLAILLDPDTELVK